MAPPAAAAVEFRAAADGAPRLGPGRNRSAWPWAQAILWRPTLISMKAMNSRRLLFKYFNYYPVFVPEPSRGVLLVLAEKGLSGMMLELERLASLGSAWASATLGYLALLPSSQGLKDPKRAVDLCSKAAADGDPYALYILAWARFILTKNKVVAAKAMLRSSQKGFAPATLAMTIFVWPNTKLTLRFIDEATRLGHKRAFAVRCGFFRTGRFGIVQRTVGYLLYPFARLRFAIALWMNPFSENILSFISTDQRPAFRA